MIFLCRKAYRVEFCVVCVKKVSFVYKMFPWVIVSDIKNI